MNASQLGEETIGGLGDLIIFLYKHNAFWEEIQKCHLTTFYAVLGVCGLVMVNIQNISVENAMVLSVNFRAKENLSFFKNVFESNWCLLFSICM